MKHLVKILAVIFFIAMIPSISVEAQIIGKKRDKVEVAADVKAILVNGLIAPVYDYTGQIDTFEGVVLQMKAQGVNPPDKEFTIIYDNNKNEYRFAENSQEIQLQSDNLTLFKRKYSEIYEYRRKRFD